ncbi:MAG TPA: multidrug effflux MFS transporter [Flavisolibacter sp.]|nr:multidrug effflux MFS transporter [Flavisolibacter sp.]
MSKQRRFLTILLLGLLTAIVPFSIDMYLPGFPAIASSLHSNVSRVALSLSSFFVGIGIGQLIYGPLLDRFGRKKPLYVGLLIYCITSLFCAYARSIELLIALRFIQAIGACSATIAATAMVRDYFRPEENAKIYSFLMLVLSISPMLAPTIGGYVAGTYGWPYIFLLLTAIIIVIFFGVYFFLSGSKGADSSYSLRPGAIWKNYRAVLRESYFTTYAVTGGIAFGGLFAYIASSPGVFIENYKLSPGQYGWLFALLASGLILASQLNTVLLRRQTSERIIGRVLLFQVSFALLLVIITAMGITGFWVVVAVLYLYLASIGFIMPNASALAMRPFEKNAGSASALLGFIQMGTGSLTTIVIGLLGIKTVFPMALSLLVCSMLALVLLLLVRRKGR